MKFQYPLLRIPPLFITSGMIDDGAVIARTVADQAIQTAKLADLAVAAAKLADGAVLTPKLGTSSVTTATLADLAVAAAKLADGAVLTGKIADGAVTTIKIPNAAIVNALIANLAVGTANLQTGAITTALIQTAAITDALIANVAAGKITAGTVTAAIEMIAATITGGLIRTAASGQRWELSSPAGANKLISYSGQSGETGPGELSINANPYTVGTWLRLKTPDFTDAGPLLDLVAGITGVVGRYAAFANIEHLDVPGKLNVSGDLAVTGTISGNHNPPSWTYPPLSNGWVNFGAGFGSARYSKDDQGIVRLEGLIAGGATAVGTVLFTLPVGYRPLAQTMHIVFDSPAQVSRIDIDTSGNVLAQVVASNGYLSLYGISFGTN